MLTIPIEVPSSEAAFSRYLNELHTARADRVLLDICEFFDDGIDRERKLSALKEAISRLEREGFEAGVWTNTLGYGVERNALFQKKFSGSLRLTAFDGHSGSAVCPLDEAFTKAMQQNIRDFANAGAKLILLDDDLVLSVRPGLTCCCEEHLKRFGEKYGRSFSREEIKASFCGAPNDLRTFWLRFTGETELNFCRGLRAAADSVDPKLRMGLCASFTHFDLEGWDVKAAARLLAGERNRPLLRLSGAPYWPALSPKYAGQDLKGVLESVRREIALLAESGIEVMDENDPYPRDPSVIPPVLTEAYDRAMTAEKDCGRLNYVLNCGSDHAETDTPYFHAMLKDEADTSRLAEWFGNKKPLGFRAFCPQSSILKAFLPSKYPGDGEIFCRFTQPLSGIFAANLGVPTQYSEEAPRIVFGEDARCLSADDFKNGLLLDRPAATILSSGGISLGAFLDAAENGIFFTEDEKHRRFAVLPFDGAALFPQKGSAPKIAVGQKELLSAYRSLSGKPLPAAVSFAPKLYFRLSESADGKSLAVLLLNTGERDQSGVFLSTAEKYRPASFCGALPREEADGFRFDLKPFGFAGLLLEKI